VRKWSSGGRSAPSLADDLCLDLFMRHYVCWIETVWRETLRPPCGFGPLAQASTARHQAVTERLEAEFAACLPPGSFERCSRTHG
jgi:hypothetical protein